MKKGMIVLTLLLCLTLSACGGEKEAEQGQQSFLGKTIGLAEDAVLLKVDGREVAAWQYLYWLNRGWETVCRQYGAGDAGVDWETPVEGGTLAGYVKQQALENTILYATVEDWAEKYDCTLTEAEKRELAAEWDTQAAERGGEAIYLAELAKQGLDRTRAEALSAVGVQYGKLLRFCRTEGSPLCPDDAALAAYADAVGVLTVDRILIAGGEDREAARQKAAEVFSTLNNAPDQAAAFDALAKEGDDPAGARTVTRGGGMLPAALEEAAAALAVGQFSGILESEEGFSILKRLPPVREELLDRYFDALLLSAAAEAFVAQTQEYAELDVVDFDIGRRALTPAS